MSEILPGVRHYQTTGFAKTWEAYDALSADDGWKVNVGVDDPSSQWKEGRINDRRVVVHTPHEPRQEETQ